MCVIVTKKTLSFAIFALLVLMLQFFTTFLTHNLLTFFYHFGFVIIPLLLVTFLLWPCVFRVLPFFAHTKHMAWIFVPIKKHLKCLALFMMGVYKVWWEGFSIFIKNNLTGVVGLNAKRLTHKKWFEKFYLYVGESLLGRRWRNDFLGRFENRIIYYPW